MRITGLIILTTILMSSTYAQVFAPRMKHFGIEEGLPSNVIYFVTKDKNGFIWIGTDAGATRYDGANFITYTIAEGLVNNDIFNIFCDSKGRVWFNSLSKEVCYYYRGKIHNKHNDSLLKKLNFDSEIAPIREDAEGNVWIQSFKTSVYKLSDTNVTTYHWEYLPEKGFAQSGNYSYKGTKYITSTSGLVYTEGNQLRFIDTANTSIVNNVLNISPYVDVCYLPDHSIRIDSVQNKLKNYAVLRRELYLSKESDSSFWAFGSKGTDYYILGHKKPIIKSLLVDHNPSYIFCDNEKNTWISTLDNGLYKIYAKNNLSFADSKNNINLSFRSVVADGKNIYAGNVKGEVVRLSASENPKIITRLEAQLGHINRLLTMTILDKQHLIITTDVGSFILNTQTGQTIRITSLGATKNHTLFKDTIMIVGHTFVVLYNFKTNGEKMTNFNRRLYACTQHDAKLLIGAIDGLYTIEHDTLLPYSLDIHLENRISDLKSVNQLLFAATSDNGIFQIEKNKCTRQFNQGNGLTTNSVNRILHHLGKLFVATKLGINIIDLKTNRYSYLFEPDGLASNIVNDIFIQNDSLVAATDKGISVFNIKEIGQAKKPSYSINPITIGKTNFWNVQNITSHSDQVIQLIANSISFNTNGKIKHYYRIKNIDSNWSVTVDPMIVIKNLPPGEYTFETYASNTYNINSEVLTINIDIVPYFYQHWIFKSCVILLLLCSLYFLYKYLFQRIKRQEKNKRETLHRMTELELHAWRSKINPHFVFNSLNAMQSFFEEQNFETGNIYLTRFSTIMRKTIERSNNLFNTIADEIEYQSNYLGLEKLKREENFHFEINCPPDILNVLVPSMIIQPVIENCLKHGIQDKNDGKISLSFKRENRLIHAIITDNGVGLRLPYTPSNGLLLIREKIHLIEKLQPQHIEFLFENIINEEGNVAGLKTTFIFTDSYK